MKILIIEDNKDILKLIGSGLQREGFVVDTTTRGETGLEYIKEHAYDLIILDLHLPDKHGDEICRELRTSGCETPILILTVSTEVENKVGLLNLGTDDYLTKPFKFEELLARVRALLRRPKQVLPDILEYEIIKLDAQRQLVEIGGKEVTLTNKEYQLLEHLMRNRDSLVSKVNLMEHVWDSKVDLFSNTIETHILNLRKKLGPKASKYIKTVSGRGYKIG